MTTLLGLEFFKIRRKSIGTMMLLVLFVEMMWAFMSISRSIARNPDHAGWETVLYIISSMNGLFMPIITAIVVSRICDMEHKGSTWKMLVATDVSRSRLYAAKFICANALLLGITVVQVVLMIVFGLVQELPGGPPVEWLLRFAGATLLTTLAVTALQQWISLAIHNQAFALCLGMLGGFIGMTAGLFPAAVRCLIIWSYYMDLSPVAYRYAESSGDYFVQPAAFGLAAAAVAIAVLLYNAGRFHVTRQEI